MNLQKKLKFGLLALAIVLVAIGRSGECAATLQGNLHAALRSAVGQHGHRAR